jgi:RNA polymerase sigma-70 factor (ECF subfamily)
MDARAFERLVREHQQMVFCVALSYCRDRAAAEDVAQEAFLKAFRSAETVRNPAQMKTWLYSIARFTAIDWLRKQKREHAAESARGAAAADPPAEDDRGSLVLEAVRSLKDDQREIMMLRYVKGLSYQEIARVVGSTPSAVGEKLHRIREAVRARLKTEVRS